jgi:hypothetical protein
VCDRTDVRYEWMVARRHYTPQERKRLSLERDTVDVGEYPQQFRRKHPVLQAKAERAVRREVHRRLADGREDVDEVRRREVRKCPPIRLGELIAMKAERRAGLREEPRKSWQARLRRQQRRGRPGRPTPQPDP